MPRHYLWCMRSQVPSLDCKKYPQQTVGLMNTLRSVCTVQQQQQHVCESCPQVFKSEINPAAGRGHLEASQHPSSPGFIVKWKIKVQRCRDILSRSQEVGVKAQTQTTSPNYQILCPSLSLAQNTAARAPLKAKGCRTDASHYTPVQTHLTILQFFKTTDLACVGNERGN